MSFNRATKSEVLIAESLSLIAEGTAMVLVIACVVVWFAIYATPVTP